MITGFGINDIYHKKHQETEGGVRYLQKLPKSFCPLTLAGLFPTIGGK
jgi:hypothetical protein